MHNQRQLSASRLHIPGFKRTKTDIDTTNSPHHSNDFLAEKSLQEKVADDIEKRCMLLTSNSYLNAENNINELTILPSFLLRPLDEWRILNEIERSIVQLQKVKTDFRRGDSKHTLQQNSIYETLDETVESMNFNTNKEKYQLHQGIDGWQIRLNVELNNNDIIVKELETRLKKLDDSVRCLQEINQRLQSQFPCTAQLDSSQLELD